MSAGLSSVRLPLLRRNHPASWALSSTGEVNDRPGMNEVSKNPFARSITPLDSGSLAEDLPT